MATKETDNSAAKRVTDNIISALRDLTNCGFMPVVVLGMHLDTNEVVAMPVGNLEHHEVESLVAHAKIIRSRT